MAISFAFLVGWGTVAMSQQPQPTAMPTKLPPITTNIQPTEPPKTQWSRFPDASPTTPSVPVGTPPALTPPAMIPPPASTPAPSTAQPGLVPKTLTFQKNAGEASPSTPPVLTPIPTPAAPVPALPTALTRTPTQESKKESSTVGEKKDKKDDKAKEKSAKDDKDDKDKDEQDKKEKDEQDEKDRKAKARTAVPTRAEVFRLSSDTELDDRIRTALKNTKDKFPQTQSTGVSESPYQPRTFAPSKVTMQPSYVVHDRLYFEEMNSERAGWDLGVIQPFVSAAYFGRDVFMLPHNVASGFWRNRWDTNIGKCPPATSTPYYLYPHGFTKGGVMVFATYYTGMAFIFP